MWGHIQALPLRSCVISVLRLPPLPSGVDTSSDPMGWCEGLQAESFENNRYSVNSSYYFYFEVDGDVIPLLKSFHWPFFAYRMKSNCLS